MRRHVLGFAVVVLLLPAGVGNAAASASTPKDPCAPQPASAVPAPLTSQQCIAASQILSNNSYLRGLLAGLRYTVGRPDPWGGDHGDLGAVLDVHLATELSVARTEIPVADFPSQSSDTYYALHNAVSINRATGLTVFVDLHRRRVVWVMPTPLGSEGPPPTSTPPYTLPSGFTEGTAGATAADAAAGLVLHLVMFDSTGRLFQEEWFDPVSGDAVTDVYDPEGKLAASMVSTITGSTVHVTSISYVLRTWTSGTGTLPIGGAQILELDSRSLPARLQNGTQLGITNLGPATVDGLTAIRLHGTAGIPYWGLLFDVRRGDIWVDPTTYLPIKVVLSDSFSPTDTTVVCSWLPRTPETIKTAALAVPAGYTHAPSSGLPHIFGD